MKMTLYMIIAQLVEQKYCGRAKMNKYQRALETLKKIPNRIPLKSFTDDVVKEVDEAFKTLQDLVDKATPKKAIVEKGWYYKNFRCPCCMNLVAEKMYVYSENELTIQNYCSACGQALKWSDEE